MKVWEAMAILSKAPAGADVWVSLLRTSWVDVAHIEVDEGGEFVRFAGGDAQLRDGADNELGLLTEIAEDIA